MSLSLLLEDNYWSSINLAPNLSWQMDWFSRKRHELCPAYLLTLFSSVLQTTVPLRVSQSHHCKWAELHFQYCLVTVYFCIPGKGASCFEMAFATVYLGSALGEGLTWELTNSIYSAKCLIKWKRQWLPLDSFWVIFLLLWFIFLLSLDQAWFYFAFGADIIPSRWDLSAVWWLLIMLTGTLGTELSKSQIQDFGTFDPRYNWPKCKLSKKLTAFSYYGPVFFLKNIYLLWTYTQFSSIRSQFSVPKIWTGPQP